MKHKLIALSLLLLSSFTTASGNVDQFHDYSTKGSDYKVLENIWLKAGDIKFSSIKEVSVYRKNYPASIFALTATVEVQTVCHFGAPELNKYEDRLADYEIHIIEDQDRLIHNALISEIVSLSNLKDFETYNLPSNRHLFWKDGKYALYLSPSSELVDDEYVLWADEKYIKVIFKGFRNGGGMGALSSFIEKNLKFRLAGIELVPKLWSAKNCKEFLKLYKKGTFSTK